MTVGQQSPVILDSHLFHILYFVLMAGCDPLAQNGWGCHDTHLVTELELQRICTFRTKSFAVSLLLLQKAIMQSS